ncbi:MAG TPA: DUF874 family protein, partial [Candidatus Acidoferrum sp.]|nr:DUF874 family protein [Candidatus Acidoferrum sp.]
MEPQSSSPSERQPSSHADSRGGETDDNGGVSETNQDPARSGESTRIEQAESRTEQAETRTEQAKTRTEQAETRTEQAEARTEQAKTRTEQAEIRTEQAETRTEQAIRDSELNYRRLFEAAMDGIVILEADSGRISDVNPFLIEMLGFSRAALVGKVVWEVGAFKEILRDSAGFNQLRQQGYVRQSNLPLITRDGVKIAVEFVSSVYQAGTGKLIQFNVRDITERKRIEQQVRGLSNELEQGVVERHQLEAQFIE